MGYFCVVVRGVGGDFGHIYHIIMGLSVTKKFEVAFSEKGIE